MSATTKKYLVFFAVTLLVSIAIGALWGRGSAVDDNAVSMPMVAGSSPTMSSLAEAGGG